MQLQKMQLHIPKLQQAPTSYDAPRKITHLSSPAAMFSDEVGMDEEETARALNPTVNFGIQVEPLFQDLSPKAGYVPEKGLYFAGRRPSCTVIGLARSDFKRSEEVLITVTEHLLHLGKSIQEHQQSYTLFIIDALPYDTFSGVEAIVRETANNTLYFNHKPLVSVVEKGTPGLLSRLQERYSDTPLRFIEAKKYGTDVIDAQLFRQPRY